MKTSSFHKLINFGEIIDRFTIMNSIPNIRLRNNTVIQRWFDIESTFELNNQSSFFQEKIIESFITFSRAHMVQCSIFAGKDLTLQYGTSLSIGSF